MILPVIWILVHALRHNRVPGGPTLEGVLDHAFARSDWEIQWGHPQEPLICSFENKPFRSINLGVAASAKQPTKTLHYLARCSGMTKRITFHHLCHGAGQDVACLPLPGPEDARFNLQNAQQILNHSN